MAAKSHRYKDRFAETSEIPTLAPSETKAGKPTEPGKPTDPGTPTDPGKPTALLKLTKAESR